MMQHTAIMSAAVFRFAVFGAAFITTIAAWRGETPPVDPANVKCSGPRCAHRFRGAAEPARRQILRSHRATHQTATGRTKREQDELVVPTQTVPGGRTDQQGVRFARGSDANNATAVPAAVAGEGYPGSPEGGEAIIVGITAPDAGANERTGNNFPTSSPTFVNQNCECSGQTNSNGDGGTDPGPPGGRDDCESEFFGSLYCYTDPGICSDGQPSNQVANAEYSYIACELCSIDEDCNDSEYGPFCGTNIGYCSECNDHVDCNTSTEYVALLL